MQSIVYVSETGNKNDEDQFAVFDYDNEYEKKDLLKHTLDEIVEEFGTIYSLVIRVESFD